MGNSQDKYLVVPENFRMATLTECRTSFNSQKYEACGKTATEALEQLTKLCKCYNVPVPKPIPDRDDSYYCGILDVPYMFKNKKRLNTVWFTDRNGMKVATVYYPNYN